ncbi:hypothetical protein MWMV18_MWMV18_01458 [Acinetobacter calcoaceticus]|nr:hypothetical protein MWMV18_MWMV18_01458 [Acinetobacter calcoaceticus]
MKDIEILEVNEIGDYEEGLIDQPYFWNPLL